MKILKAKFTTGILMLILIISSSLPAISDLYKVTDRTLATSYIIIIFTSFFILILISLTYLFNTIFFRFITKQIIKNKITFLNFILLSLNVNVIILSFLKLIIKIDKPWLVLFNPFYFLVQYIFYKFITKEEGVGKIQALYFLVVVFIFSIVGQLIKS